MNMEDKQNKSEIREVMDIIELSKYLGIGKSKIYNLIRQKKIPASRIGRQYRFAKSVIDQWLKERLITTPVEDHTPLFNQKEK
jgi:excisionase family DNA binding protein